MTSVSVSACLAALLCATGAHAQDHAPVAVADTATGQAVAGNEPELPGEILVTATRDPTRASKTPVALTAVKGDTLLAQGVTNPTNLGELVPNLYINRAGTNNVGMQITIRGVTSSDTTDKGDPSAAFMLDGIYLARPQAQEVSFFDIARIEVLRGPQGTLFGRNTTAGLVNIITNKPRLGETHGSLVGTYGNYDTVQLTGVVNLPVADGIAVRAAGNWDRRDSYMIMGPRFTTSVNPFKNNVSGRLATLFDLGDGSLTITGDYSSLKGSLINLLPLGNFYARSDYTVAGRIPQYVGDGKSSKDLRFQNAANTNPTGADSHTWGIGADLGYDVGPLTVNYLGSYRELSRSEDGLAIQDSGAAPFAIRFRGEYWQNSQELRLSTNGDGPIKAQAGAYYFKERSRTLNYYLGYNSPTPGTAGYIFGFPQNPTVAESLAGFGQVTYRLIDTLRLTGGIRYSSDLKRRNGFTITCRALGCENDSPVQTGDIVLPNIARARFSKTTWRAGFDYDVNPATLFYGTVSTGYKAGGFNDGCRKRSPTDTGCRITTPQGLYYRPETLTSYELGLKTRIRDILALNLAAFHYDYKDMQLGQFLDTACGGPCTVTTNAGVAKVDGVELEGTLRAARTSRFDFSATWLNARFTDFKPIPTDDWSGRKLDRAPDITVSAGYTHTIFLGNGSRVEAGVRTNISDSYYLSALGTRNQFRIPSNTKTDLLLTYTAPDDVWYVQGYLRNLEDNIIVSGVATGRFAGANYTDPRTYGIRTGVRF